MTIANIMVSIGIAVMVFIVTVIVAYMICQLVLIALHNDYRHKDRNLVIPAFETCVSCNIITATPTDQQVSVRNYYVEGSGQLCEGCYNILYKIPSKHASQWYA